MAVTVQEAQVVFSAEGMGRVASEAAKAKGVLNSLAGAAGKVGSSLRSAFSGIGAQLGALGVAAGAAKVFQLAAGAEQTAISLEVLTGSAESAKQMLMDIRALDMKTVFGTKDLADNAKLMMQQGMGAEQAMKTLTGLTEIAAGDTDALYRLSLAMAQVNNAGRLTGQDLLQLINAGFNPLKMISDKTGESMGDLRKKMEQGAISAEQVQWALAALTTGSGRLAGMNERISQTTAGMFAKMKSSLELVAIEFGTNLLPTANKFLQTMLQHMPQITSAAKWFAEVLLSAVDGFFAVQNALTEFGIAAGVVAGNFGSIWDAAFRDLASLAQAGFRYLTDNGMKAIEFMRDAAMQLSPSHLAKVAMGEAQLKMPAVQLSDFEFTSALANEMTSIQSDIDAAITEWKDANKPAKMEQKPPEKTPAEGPGAFPGMAGAAASTAAAQQIERGSAQSMFQSIANKLQSKTMEEIGKAQLAAQHEANKIAMQTLNAVSILPFGLQ
jgi:tape measure domain-containing protein